MVIHHSRGELQGGGVPAWRMQCDCSRARDRGAPLSAYRGEKPCTKSRGSITRIGMKKENKGKSK